MQGALILRGRSELTALHSAKYDGQAMRRFVTPLPAEDRDRQKEGNTLVAWSNYPETG
jgi:hypothetical protein